MNKCIETNEYIDLKRKIFSNFIFLFITFIVTISSLIYGYITKQNNLLSYKSYERFTCQDKSKMTIEINKADGWKYIDGYFIHNNSSIEAQLCEVTKEKNNERD